MFENVCNDLNRWYLEGENGAFATSEAESCSRRRITSHSACNCCLVADNFVDCALD